MNHTSIYVLKYINDWHLFWSRTIVIPLDGLVTKNQRLNTKCQPKFLLLFLVQKRKQARLSSSLFKRNNNKNFVWHLVFSHWVLVTRISNGKDKCVQNSNRFLITTYLLIIFTVKKILKNYCLINTYKETKIHHSSTFYKHKSCN